MDRRSPTVRSCVLMGILAVSVVILVLQYGNRIKSRFHFSSSSPRPFKTISTVKGIYSFANVCIESLNPPKLLKNNRELFNVTKKIVVYGQHNRSNGPVNIRVAGSINSRWNHWELHFTNRTAPKEFRFRSGDTAFFIQPTCPGNFHHFFEDEFLPLYSVVSLSNRLHPGSANQIIYRTPESVKNRCTDRSIYEAILKTLYINSVHDVFFNLPDDACFRHTVFGSAPLVRRRRDIVDHVLRFYQLPVFDVSNSSGLFVTILSRSDRRILNVPDLVSFVREAGFQNVRFVDFEKISVLEQLGIMSTTKLFIGVKGAGLHWSIFMPKGSFLVELAWPQKHWGFYYRRFVPSYGIVWRGVGVNDVRLNWTSYERIVRKGIPVKEEEKPTLIKTHPRSIGDNIWKWSDIFVQKKEISSTLEEIHKSFKTIK